MFLLPTISIHISSESLCTFFKGLTDAFLRKASWMSDWRWYGKIYPRSTYINKTFKNFREEIQKHYENGADDGHIKHKFLKHHQSVFFYKNIFEIWLYNVFMASQVFDSSKNRGSTH